MVSAIPKNLPPIDQNYQYGNYNQGAKVPFGGYTAGAPRVNPGVQVEPTTGINVPILTSFVDDGNNNTIAAGVQGGEGFGTVYDTAGGDFYTNGTGHATYTKWFMG